MPDDENDGQISDDQSASEITQSDEQNSLEAGGTSGLTSEGEGTNELSESDKRSLQDLMADPTDTQTATPTPAKTGDCSSWENDPRGFAKIVADNYLSTEFDHMPGLVRPEGMSCWPSQPGGKVSDFCYLHYSDGWNVIVSLANIPDFVKARAIKPEMKQRCTYAYDCTASGTLSFTRRSCDDYPP